MLVGTGLLIAVYVIAQQVEIKSILVGAHSPTPHFEHRSGEQSRRLPDLVVVAVLRLWVGAGQRGRVALAVVGAVSVIAIV